MATVYVREHGAMLSRRGKRLRVVKDGQVLEEVPMIHVSQVVLVGEVRVTSQAMGMLLGHGVDVVYWDEDYEAQGRLMHSGSKFAELRSCQLQKVNDKKAVLEIARALVMGKLSSQRVILEQQLERVSGKGAKQKVRRAISGVSRALGGVKRAKTKEVLRGLQGRSEADYFAAWAVLCPSQTPYLPLLSFGTVLLTNLAMTTVKLVGLDPYLGFFHAFYYGQPSLVLDVVEEFRPILVDRLVLDLLQSGEIKPSHYESSRGAPALTGKGRELFLRAYEGFLQTKVFYAYGKETTSYRRILELQVRQLGRVVLGKEERYRAMGMG